MKRSGGQSTWSKNWWRQGAGSMIGTVEGSAVD
jgi:hypothetical protein